MDGYTKQSIIHEANAGAKDDDSDADFNQLVVADDDDESSPAADVAAQGNGMEMDFNKLSRAMEGLRPKEAISFGPAVATGTSIFFMLAGMALFLFAWRRRLIRVQKPLLT
jgi:hypothetical protein